MTTIAVKGRTMCSDGQITRGDLIDCDTMQKIYPVGGCLIGISGDLVGALDFIEWFEKDALTTMAQEDYPTLNIAIPEDLLDDGYNCLVLYQTGDVVEFIGTEKGTKSLIIEKEHYAVGSGMPYALAAMDAGVSVEEAVEVAIKRDVFSGGDVQVFNLPPEPRTLTEEDVRALSDTQKDNMIIYGDPDYEQPPSENTLEEVSELLEENISRSVDLLEDYPE